MSPANCWNLRVTAEVNQGDRKYMEDVTSVQFERIKSDKAVVEYAAFAIFDGHGGKDAAHFARDHLLENIKLQKGFFSNDVEVVKKAISDAFVATHLAMWNKLPDWPKTSLGHPSTAGTTASLVIIRGSRMYVANVGDSTIVMGVKDSEDDPNHSSKSYATMDLTIDHKPESYKERRRIEKCGGCVMNKSGVNRVVWARPKINHTGPIRRSTKLDQIPFLAVARSLGDLWSFNSALNEFVVSPVPDVYVHDLQKNKDQFIVLASDGLWNMIRPQEAVKFVEDMEADKMRGDTSWGSPAHRLVQIALASWALRRIRADNISVIVVIVESRKLEPSKRKGVYFESWTSAKDGEDGSTLTGPFSGTTQTLKAISNKSTHAAATNRSPDQPSTSAKNPEPLQDSSISSSNGDINDDVITTPKPRMKTRFSNDRQPTSSGIKETRLTRSQGKKSPGKKASKRRKTMSDVPIGGVKTRRMSLRPVRSKKVKSEEKIKLPKTPARVSTKTRRRL